MEAGEAKTMVHLEFQDLLPIMARELGGDGLINELCKGYRMLMDGDKGVITIDSLKKNSALMRLQDFSEEELKNMIREGDMDGDGALDQIEFCILMFRLSPDLLDVAQDLLHKAEQQNTVHQK